MVQGWTFHRGGVCRHVTSVGARSRPTELKRGWQHRAPRCLEERHRRRQVMPTLTDPTRAAGPVGFSSIDRVAVRLIPTHNHSVYGCAGLSHLQVWPPSRHVCTFLQRCSRAGVLGCRGFLVERAAAQVCREAGGRVGLTGSSVTWMWEHWMDGALRSTVVSPLHGDGTA